MPDDLLLPDGRHMRQGDAAYVFGCIADSVCCSVVGISNMGKSALLRLLAEPSVPATYLGDAAPAHSYVLIDCNRMLELSEQGFYELVLRCMRERLAAENADSALQTALRDAYENGLPLDEAKQQVFIGIARDNGLPMPW